MALLKVQNIYKTYEESPLLNNINFQLEQGEILCLLGPSGCGKSTLLRIIAGLENAEKGQVLFDDADISHVPPHHRKFGMMFQEFALFPHRNVFDNVAFGLQIKKRPQKEIEEQVRDFLDLVGLASLVDRKVNDLSGGERQRVALARSLAPRPKLLMLDEPMGSLDRMLRERLILDLRRILKKIGVTAIFVTHDHTEAFAVADLIAVFDQGRISQIAQPETLYRSPTNIGVAKFLGFENFIQGSVLDEKKVKTDIGILTVDSVNQARGNKVTLLIRPEAGRIQKEEESIQPGESLIEGNIIDRRFQGAHSRIVFKTDRGQTLVLTLPMDDTANHSNESIQLALNPAAIIVIP